MPNQILRRRGTAAQHTSFTGGTAELTVDTTNLTVKIHDSSTVGGFPFHKFASAKTTLDANGIVYAASTTTLTTSTAFTWDGTTLTVDGDLTFTGAQTIATSTGALTINTGSAAALNFNINGTNAWSITSGSILQSNGAQTIQSSSGILTVTGTGGLTLSTASNTNILLSPNGTGIIQCSSAVATGTTTTSGLALSVNSLTTGTGLYVASSSLTSGLLVNLQVSGTAAAASQTALNILTAGANGTVAITTYGAQI